jgi:uncharacterized protein
MPIAAAPVITLIIAAALGVLALWLGIRVTRLRMGAGIATGDGGNPLLEARCRAHANLTEYAPLALILMLVVELRSGPSPWLWVIGAALVIGRVVHPFGMERRMPNPYRMVGMALTWGAIAALVAWAVLIAYGVA